MFPLEINMLSFVDNSGSPRKGFFMSRSDMLKYLEDGTYRNEIRYVEEEITIPIKNKFSLICTLNSLEEGLI